VHTEYYEGCKPINPRIPAVHHEPHPDHPGSVGTYITAEGRALPLWTEDDVAHSYEVIALFVQRGAVAA
jgi:hypothetical protein